MRLRKVVIALLLLAAAVSFAQSGSRNSGSSKAGGGKSASSTAEQALQNPLKPRRSGKARTELLHRLKADPSVTSDPYLRSLAWQASVSKGTDQDDALDDLQAALQAKKAYLSDRRDSQAAAPSSAKLPGGASEAAKKILASPNYSSQSPTYENWLSRAFNRIHWLQIKWPRLKIKPPVLGFDWSTVTVVAWGLIIGLVAALLITAIVLFRRSHAFRRRAALGDEGEADANSEGWLERAEEWASKGDYRRAIRCAYIAGLLHFDTAHIARFDRTETNWQHLDRIERSPAVPPDVSYRPQTKVFDNVWYGMRPTSREEYEALADSVRQLGVTLGVEGQKVRAESATSTYAGQP